MISIGGILFIYISTIFMEIMLHNFFYKYPKIFQIIILKRLQIFLSRQKKDALPNERLFTTFDNYISTSSIALKSMSSSSLKSISSSSLKSISSNSLKSISPVPISSYIAGSIIIAPPRSAIGSNSSAPAGSSTFTALFISPSSNLKSILTSAPSGVSSYSSLNTSQNLIAYTNIKGSFHIKHCKLFIKFFQFTSTWFWKRFI
jgi:hypothetical protein